MTQYPTTLPTRQAPAPRTTPATPHMQLDQFAPSQTQNELWQRMSAMANTDVGRSLISAPTSKALHLRPDHVSGPREAFLIGHEFAHFHGDGSGSLHLTLPIDLVQAAVDAGWAEPHPAVALGFAPPTVVMVFAPRNDEELEIVWHLVEASFAFATRTIA